ncbi:galactose oxidase [Ilyomonas limi]|nr:galactose oxidase [Ilyomonas limi]
MNRIISILFILPMFYYSSAQMKPAVALQWKIASELPAANGQQQALGIAGPIAGINNNVLIVGGGSNFPDAAPWQGGKKQYYSALYVFKKEKDSLLNSGKVFHLPFPLAYAANCSTPKGIVCAGGENETGISKKVWLLQWDEGAGNVIVNHLPDLPVAVTNASVACIGNKIYLAGGEMRDSVSAHFYYLNLNNTAMGWQALPPLPQSVSHAVMIAQNNDKHAGLYVIGGRKKTTSGISELYSSVYAFDCITNQWSQKQSLPYALSAGTGIWWKNNILLFGGDKGETFHKTEQLIAAISNEKDSVKKEELIQQKAALQSTHPGFSNEVLEYNVAANKWTKRGAIPFTVPVTTTAILWGNEVLVPGGEIKAGVRTPQILLCHLSSKE